MKRPDVPRELKNVPKCFQKKPICGIALHLKIKYLKRKFPGVK